MRKIGITFSGIFLSISVSALISNSNSNQYIAKASVSDLFDSKYGNIWYDGKAEISSYKLSVSRYGETRLGNAVSIFVTEDFSQKQRVKTDRLAKGDTDRLPILKHNLMMDFPTGIYDYNIMLSSFVATKPFQGRPEGSTAKLTFSSQEWCGHVFHQIVPAKETLQSTSLSYFEGQDRNQQETYPKEGLFADTLYHWARGLSHPKVSVGESKETKLYSRLIDGRLTHFEPTFERARLTVSAQTTELKINDTVWKVREHKAETDSGRSYTFWVETAAPKRIIKWIFQGGKGLVEEASLVESKRTPYWSQNSNTDTALLKSIGLSPRNRLSP